MLDNRASCFALSLGMVMGFVSKGEGDENSPEVKYLLARGVTEEEVKAFNEAAMKLAGAFYREPK